MMIANIESKLKRRWVIFGVIVASVIAINRCGNDSQSAPSSQPEASKPSLSYTPEKKIGKWEYDDKYDKMRDTSSHIADLASDNFINQGFPYQGNAHLNIRLQKLSSGDKDVVFYIDKGQLPCHDDGLDCHVRVKFDSGQIHSLRATGSANGRSDVLFLRGGIKKFAADLRKAKKVIVEVSVYEEGEKQFTFSPEGLNWKHF